MKKALSIILVLLLTLSLAACGGGSGESSDSPDGDMSSSSEANGGDTGDDVSPASDREMRTCLISDSSMAGDFDQVIWRGFTMLEANGWEIKVIEALDSAEYEEVIYAMADEGYELIYLKGDAIASVLIDIADDFSALYPDVRFIMIDSYMEHDLDFATAVPVDPYESSFVGGYVAAMTSESDTIGWIGHMDTINIARFRNGFIAGAMYANPDITVEVGFTGDFFDPIKGQEAVRAMVANYPDVDVIAHAAYISGNGVLAECEAIGMPVIGCDDWQGDMGETVFWSQLKSVDIMVFETANDWIVGEDDYGTRMSFNIAAGSVPYDTRDLSALPSDVADDVVELVDGIKDGSIDIYYDDFAEYKLDY